jgi:SAM-dependent MidA family methyltransferase
LNASDHVRHLIRREGPISFDRFVEVALYDAEAGFFTRGRGAGRAAGDFITSPHVGSLFGALVARAYDRWWEALGEVDPFVVVEAGAGDGRLARDVQRAAPRCATALRYLLVERSATLREAQRERLPIEPVDEALGAFRRELGEDRPVPAEGIGPVFTALDELPAIAFEGVALGNELLDNLPFGIATWNGRRWDEVLVALDDGEGFREVTVPAVDADAALLDECVAGLDVPSGARLPIARGIDDWLHRCSGVLRRGWCCLIDYAGTASELLARGDAWLRTYSGQARGASPLERPGEQDITADVIVEQLLRAAHAAGLRLVERQSQAAWLASLGIDELVDEGRAAWEAGAARGGLDALAGRSRVSEAAALTDPNGLGAHRVFVFAKGLRAAPNREPASQTRV